MKNSDLISSRINRLRENMKREGCDYYLVFTADPHASEYIDDYYKVRAYLSGFTGSAGTLLIGMEEAILWTDGRYFIQAEKQLEGSGIKLYKMQVKGFPTLEEYLKNSLSDGMKVGCEYKLLTVEQYQKLDNICREKNAELINDDKCLYAWDDRPQLTANEIYGLPDDISGEDRQSKLQKLISKLKENKQDGFFVAELSYIMWIFNIRGSDVNYNPVAFSYAYISEDEVVLFVNKDNLNETLSQELKASDKDIAIKVLDYKDTADYLRTIKGKKIACDTEKMNAFFYLLLKEDNEITAFSNEEYAKKGIKNDVEQELLRRYHEKDAAAMVRFIMYLKEAVKHENLSEYDAACYIDSLREKTEGYTGLSFDTISGYRENGALPHYSATKEASSMLKPEGLLVVDSGGQYLGATTDITRTIVLGPLRDEEKIHYTLVLKGVLRLMNTIFLEGTCGAQLDVIAREPIWKELLDFRHGTGHGIGAFLNVHEGPQRISFSTKSKETLTPFEPGMVTSDEPGIYIENSHGIRLENEILCIEVSNNEWGRFLGFETLTLVPFEREAIIKDMLNSDEIKWLNEYHNNVYNRISPLLNSKEAQWLSESCREI